MRIGICTSGGDCPGLNATIRAVVQQAAHTGKAKIVGVYDSINGLMDRPFRTKDLELSDVSEILFRGGTILGTFNKGNPLTGPEKNKRIAAIAEGMKAKDLSCLLIVGGEGSQGIASQLTDAGIPVVGIPKTIDNDLMGTEQTIGFATCVDLVAESVMRLRSTAESHDRIMVLEVMGRDSGYIALHGGLAGGAHAILIPEIPFDLEKVYERIKNRSQRGRNFSVIVVSEGALPKGGRAIYKEESSGSQTLGGIGHFISQRLFEMSKMDTRVTILGHLQRGGGPNAWDRILATRFATHAFDLAVNKSFGRLVVLRDNKITDIKYSDIVKFARRKIGLKDDVLRSAESIGITLGR